VVGAVPDNRAKYSGDDEPRVELQVLEEDLKAVFSSAEVVLA
jgi:hypothetical protein